MTPLDTMVCERARLGRDPRFDGKFFVGVLSTGIYCRPICPARTARSENVRYFRSAAEASAAGLRPCLRCRPEAAPGTPAWNGTSSTVRRALRLMAEAPPERGGVAQLARRLGVSARHLHRLFVTHLGASPLAVARTARLQFAKQLISETRIPMARVASASGFRSVRRFNDSIRGVYGRSPSEIRRHRAPAAAERSDEYVFRLGYRPPFDWESLLAFLAARAIPGIEEIGAGAYRRSFALEGRHGILEVRHAPEARDLEARVRYPEPVSLLPIVTRLRAMFDLSADPGAVASHFRDDPLLGPMSRRYPGLRVPGAWDPFELTVRAILGQQITVAAASTLAGRVAASFGEPLSLPEAGGLSRVFPAPKALLRAETDFLPRARADAIRAVAAAFQSGGIAKASTDETFVEELLRIPGVGAWTVQYVALRALGQGDAFPSGDLVLQRKAGGDRPLTETRLRNRAEAWRPWRAYAAVHLWRAAREDAEREEEARGKEGIDDSNRPGPNRRPARTALPSASPFDARGAAHP